MVHGLITGEQERTQQPQPQLPALAVKMSSALATPQSDLNTSNTQHYKGLGNGHAPARKQQRDYLAVSCSRPVNREDTRSLKCVRHRPAF